MNIILKDWLSNPFILVVIGALISGLLIPSITSEWQNHQKELEIKTELVEKISEAVMNMVMPVHVTEVELLHDQINNDTKAKGAVERYFEEANNQYPKWETSSATIGSQLKAYYPGTSIPSKWNSFSENVSRFYANLEGDYSYTFSGIPTNREDWTKIKQNLLEQKDN